ncbi:hypothetical protein TUMSATVNIG1_56990 (plasmid) [Vibrio nigripulchritudo]|nr:hypothetical protein VNTUMSATTG_56520 [Vibrio nigripulchritudo]BDU35090.1 hypothetical protein TUMSATVNIG1_56990 [Vibrio nigripulchritudo]
MPAWFSPFTAVTIKQTYPEAYIRFSEANGKPILSNADSTGRSSVIKFDAKVADVVEFYE